MHKDTERSSGALRGWEKDSRSVCLSWLIISANTCQLSKQTRFAWVHVRDGSHGRRSRAAVKHHGRDGGKKSETILFTYGTRVGWHVTSHTGLEIKNIYTGVYKNTWFPLAARFPLKCVLQQLSQSSHKRTVAIAKKTKQHKVPWYRCLSPLRCLLERRCVHVRF